MILFQNHVPGLIYDSIFRHYYFLIIAIDFFVRHTLVFRYHVRAAGTKIIRRKSDLYFHGIALPQLCGQRVHILNKFLVVPFPAICLRA